MALPFRWGQQLRIPQRNDALGGALAPTSGFPAVPDSIEGIPFPVWGQVPDPATGDSIVAAQHISQYRWVKVECALQVGGKPLIHMLDAANRPIIDPSFPPFVVAMRNQGSADNSADAVGSVRSGLWHMSLIRANRDLDRFPMVHWYMRRVNDPVPHWQLEIGHGYHDTTGAISPAQVVTVDLNFLTTGVGPFEAMGTVSGSTGDATWRYKIYPSLWAGATDHGDAPNKATLEEMVVTIAAHDQSSPSQDLYLTTDGTSTGGSLFDTSIVTGARPAVKIFADPFTNDFPGGAAELRAGGATSTWRPGTHGMGYNDTFWSTPYTLDNGQTVTWNVPTGRAWEAENKFFYAGFLEFQTGGVDRWRVRLFKSTGVGGTTQRTLYVYAFGLNN